jgi:hypothetical protein
LEGAALHGGAACEAKPPPVAAVTRHLYAKETSVIRDNAIEALG